LRRPWNEKRNGLFGSPETIAMAPESITTMPIMMAPEPITATLEKSKAGKKEKG
jgi:hypothetical protein